MAKYSPETIIGLGNRGLFRAYLITTDINNDVNKEVYRYINLHDLVDVFSNSIDGSVSKVTVAKPALHGAITFVCSCETFIVLYTKSSQISLFN